MTKEEVSSILPFKLVNDLQRNPNYSQRAYSCAKNLAWFCCHAFKILYSSFCLGWLGRFASFRRMETCSSALAVAAKYR